MQSGSINGQTLGWRAGMTEWLPMQEISALADIFPPMVMQPNQSTAKGGNSASKPGIESHMKSHP
jgi:hypothetical protein